MINKNQVVDKFLKLVKIDSISGEEGNISNFIRRDLENLGLELMNDEIGNLIGRLKGNLATAPTLLFCAHMDTV